MFSRKDNRLSALKSAEILVKWWFIGRLPGFVQKRSAVEIGTCKIRPTR